MCLGIWPILLSTLSTLAASSLHLSLPELIKCSLLSLSKSDDRRSPASSPALESPYVPFVSTYPMASISWNPPALEHMVHLQQNLLKMQNSLPNSPFISSFNWTLTLPRRPCFWAGYFSRGPCVHPQPTMFILYTAMRVILLNQGQLTALLCSVSSKWVPVSLWVAAKALARAHPAFCHLPNLPLLLWLPLAISLLRSLGSSHPALPVIPQGLLGMLLPYDFTQASPSTFNVLL